MKTEVGAFIDTAGWIALIHRRDDYHQQAMHIYAGLGHVKRMTTDAVLIESCKDRGISKAFTTDHHFEQAGFEKLI